jgi:hypothetical protein
VTISGGGWRRTEALGYVWDVGLLAWVPAQQALLNTGSLSVTTTNDGTFAKEAGGNLAILAGAVAGGAVAVSAAALPLPTGAATEATLLTRTKPADQQHVIIDTSPTGPPLSVTGPLTDAQLRASAVPVSAATLPLPSGAATLAGQTQPGVDIGDVTVNNAAGAAAVNIQDGGNTITVDGTVAVTSTDLTNLDVALSTRTKPSDQQHVIVDSSAATSAATATVDPPAYTEGVSEPLSQDLAGNARVKPMALVSDTRESYLSGETQPMSLTSDGRLRVSMSLADSFIDFFGDLDPYGAADFFGVPDVGPYNTAFPLGRG